MFPDLHIDSRGSVNPAWYRNAVLNPIVKLYDSTVDCSLILMDDNARPHRAVIFDDFLDIQFPRVWYHSKRRRQWVGIKGIAHNGHRDPKCPSASAFVWFEKTQGPLVKVLTVPEWRPMKQLAVRVHFLRYGGLLDDWTEPGPRVNGIFRIHWSQHILTTQSERPN
ncbi:hypothetical protein TNCV_522321 [Trichonephila clavipes]|nr:hypothetical protein TNCV_522321 [Trichonephila clavipes]